MEKNLNFKCTLTNIDPVCLSYLMDIIGRMEVQNATAESGHISFECSGTGVTQLVDLLQRDIILCNISYRRIKSL